MISYKFTVDNPKDLEFYTPVEVIFGIDAQATVDDLFETFKGFLGTLGYQMDNYELTYNEGDENENL